MSFWFDSTANRWRIRIRRGGREVARYLPPGITKQQAEEAHVAAMREFFDMAVLNKKPRRTIAEALTKYLEEYNVHNRHPKNAISNARILLPFIRGRYLDDVGHVAESVRAERRWSSATRNRRLALLRRVGNLAYRKWGWLDRPVAIDLLPENNARLVSLTPEQVRAIAKRAGQYLVLAEHWVMLAAYTGMRQSEIARLTGDDWQGGAIQVRTSKNGRPRMVPVHRKARRALGVWCAAHGSRPGNRWLYRQFNRAVQDLGYGDVHYHDLRHFFASQLVNAGVDLYTVGAILGHADRRSTQRYAHLSTESLSAAVRRVK